MKEPLVNLGKLSAWRILPMVFCLFALTFSPAFALAGDKEIALQDDINPVVPPLIEQITGLDVQNVAFDEGDITLTVGGLSYVFENIPTTQPTGPVSMSVSVYDAGGNHTQTIAFTNISVIDPNRVDFNAVVMDAGGATVDIVNGSMTGMQDELYNAVASIDSNGVSELMVVDFSALAEDGYGPSNVIVVDDVVVGAVIVITVVAFVALTCVFLGWWGC